MSFSNGDMYEGEWKNGKKHGKGVYHFNNQSVYEGDFYEGYRHGQGEYRFKNGKVLQTEWAKDIPLGNK